MKAADISKYIKELKIGADADLSAVKKDLLAKLCEDAGEIPGALATLGELNVELSDRMSQVTDENRYAELERSQKLVEDTEAELAEIAKNMPSESEKKMSVLVAVDEAEGDDDRKLNRPVAISAEERALQEKSAGKSGDVTFKDAGKRNGFIGKTASSKEDKEKKLEKKADELIKKRKQEQETERKRREEAEKARKAQEKKAQEQKDADKTDPAKAQSKDKKDRSQPENATSSGNGSKASAAASMDQRLAAALKLFYDRNYAKARDELKTLANAKDLSKTDLGTAKFFYGKMFDEGKGGPQDDEAARFWMEEAAKLKDVSALMWLGGKLAEATPESAADNVVLTARALKCFERADKYSQPDGNITAKNKYIEVCENKPIYRSAKKRACAYCDELAGQKNDAYEKKQYDDKKEAIKENYKANNAAKFSGGGVLIKDIRDVCVLIGALMTVFADFTIFMTLQNKGASLPRVFSMNGSVARSMSSVLEPLAAFFGKIIEGVSETFADSYVNFVFPGTLLFGLIAFTLGRLLIGLESYESRGRLTEIVCEVAAVASLLTIFGNLALYVFPGGSMLYFGGAFAVAVIMVGVTAAAALLTIMVRN